MIVKNEEKYLQKCLESVSGIVDEINIVDTGSTDATKEIAAKFTDRIYNYTWIDDFADARNYSFSKATKDYILWLDADDIIKEEDKNKLIELKKSINYDDADMIKVTYNYSFDSNGNVTLSVLRERLLKRASNYRWQEPIHEYILASGKIKIHSEIAVTHTGNNERNADRNLKILKRLNDNSTLNPRNLHLLSNELYLNGRYEEAVYYFKKYIDTYGTTEKFYTYNLVFYMVDCYIRLKEHATAIQTALKIFEYITPDADVLTKLGICYDALGKTDNAIFWTEMALNIQKPSEDTRPVIFNDYYYFMPYIFLASYYLKNNQVEKAIRANEMARSFDNNSPYVKKNIETFLKYYKQIYEGVVREGI